MGLSRCYVVLREAGNVPGEINNNAIMKIKSIIRSVITLGLLAGGLTACMTEKEGKEGGCCSKDKKEVVYQIKGLGAVIR